MDSRQEILDRLRVRLGREPTSAALDVRRDDHGRLRPSIGGDLSRPFVEQLLRQSSTVEVIEAWHEVPEAVARYLRSMDIPSKAVGWPLLAGHPWSAAGVDFAARAARDGDAVGITGCQWAIAETGTLVLLSGPSTPATVSLLPETHIAIVAASAIVATMEEVWARIGTLPRSVNLISGPSRTGDIEQTIVLGAHGPYRVHVVLVSAA